MNVMGDLPDFANAWAGVEAKHHQILFDFELMGLLFDHDLELCVLGCHFRFVVSHQQTFGLDFRKLLEEFFVGR